MNDKKFDQYIVSFFLYLLASVILLGPYFTPFSVLGPRGILRADQVLIPVLATLIIIFYSDQFVIPNNLAVLAIASMVGIISLAIFTNTILYRGTTDIGDLFDVIIWISYLALIITVPGNISIKQAKRTMLLIIWLSIGVALLGILQWYNVNVATEIIAPIYTARLDTVGRQPTATLLNPNSLGKLMLFPFFFSFAQLYRTYTVENLAQSVQKLVFWSALITIPVVTVVFSNSRSALVGLLFGLTICILIVTLAQLGKRKKRIKFLTFIFLFGTFSLYLIIDILEVGRFANLQNPFQDSSLRTRFEIWERIFPVILERPLLGYGPSKSAQLEVGVPYIDSGYLSWWYRYGLIGLSALAAVVLAGIKTGINLVISKSVFNKSPVLWGTAIAATGWFSGAIVFGGFNNVLQDRRIFTLALFIISLLISAQVKRIDLSKQQT